jgi:hypothetical protein
VTNYYIVILSLFVKIIGERKKRYCFDRKKVHVRLLLSDLRANWKTARGNMLFYELTLIDHEDEGLVVVGVEVGILDGRLLLLADPLPLRVQQLDLNVRIWKRDSFGLRIRWFGYLRA